MVNGSLALALLFAGHCLADFVFQSRSMVARKEREPRWLVYHGLEVWLLQALVLVPVFPSGGSCAAVTAIALTHLAIDAAKIRLQRAFGRRLAWFALDQLLHALSLLVATRFLQESALEPSSGSSGLDAAVPWTIGFYAFNVHGGSAIVSGVLERFRTANAGAGSPGVGQTIGVLERMVMLTLVVLGEWSALGFVLTAKSVARFKELENKEFAETYLVGTLTSFLVAGGSGLLLRALVAGRI